MRSRIYRVTVEGEARTRPTAVRAKVLRTRGWWSRRCPGLDVEIARVRSPS